MTIQSVRGTRDLLPAETRVWQMVEGKARQIFDLYAYSEVRTPMFEETELFARSIGTQTDIVQKELYSFEDRKGKSFSLRPEGTASIVRAFIEHGLYHNKLVNKLYYMGPMFRHERPQKGRYRQFHQLGAEVLGSDHPAIEAEVIEMLGRFFAELNLRGLTLLVNSVGCRDCRPAYVELLRHEFEKNAQSFCPDCRQRAKTNPLRVLDCKVPSCQPLIHQLPSILEHLCPACEAHFARFRKYLDQQRTEYLVDPRLVRGLDYYVRTTFELVSEELGPTQNAVVGGGRYDGLSQLLDGPPTQGFGFGLGMERMITLLEKSEPEKASGPDLFLACLDQTTFERGLTLAREFRSQGVSTSIDFEGRSLKAQMRLANRLNCRYTCIIGEDELASGEFPVKRMQDGHQVLLPLEAIASHVKI